MYKFHSMGVTYYIRAILFSFWMLLPVSVIASEPLIVAHRGASGQAPENTLPAFQLAWEQGADAIEGDFQLTKDGYVVCMHDRDTKRVSGQKLLVKDSTLAELQQLDVGSFKGAKFKGTRIPTIAEVLASIPDGKKIYIEIKSGKEIVPQLLKDITESKLSMDQIVVICFDSNVLLEIRRLATRMEVELKTSWLVNFRKDKAGVLQPTKIVAFKIMELIKANGISTSKKFVEEKFIKYAHSLGYEHHVWTIDDIPTARNYKKWETQSITTNFPAKMRDGMGASNKEKVSP